MQNRKKKKKVKIVKKPYMQGNAWEKGCWKRSAKIMGTFLVVALLYLFIGAMLMFDNVFLRVLINLCMIAAAAGIFYMNGINAGIQDVTVGEIMYQREREGKAVSKEDRERCYRRGKGFLCALSGAVVYVLIALALAIFTKEQTFTLGALPQWITQYQRRAEIGNALAYYQNSVGMEWIDYVRIAVRVMIMPFVNIVGTGSSLNLLWLERFSPLLVLLAPMGYALGYLRGPDARTQVHTDIAASNRKKKRQEKKKAQQRRQQKGPEQLI